VGSEGVLGHEAITVDSTVKALDGVGTWGFGAMSALITVETAPIRWRADGGTPTASDGHLATDGDTVNLVNRAQVKRFRAIRQGGVSATIRATYMG
jgi:hypothetical protein